MKRKSKTIITPISKKKALFLALSLGIIVFCLFSSNLGNQFTNWDDDVYVTDNPHVHKLNLENIKNIFSSTVTKTYAPLTVLSFAIEYHFVGDEPFIYVLNNILLHVGVSILIYILALQMGLSLQAAFLGALLFGIHPIHVESVAWITERKDVLYSFFYMLAVCSHWQYLETQKKRFFVFAMISGLLSILAKSMALSLPLVLLLCDWYKGRKLDFNLIKEKIPHFLYIIPVAAVTYIVNARVPAKAFIQAIMVWTWSFTFYIKKFFFPLHLSPIYELPKPIGFDHIDYNISVILFGIIIYAIVKFHRNRLFIFALLYYHFSIFFLLRMAEEVHVSVVADRFMYLPSLGICLLLGAAADTLLINMKKKNQKYFIGTCAGIILIFGILGYRTHIQNKVWKDAFTIWDAAARYSPNTSLILNNRGVIYLRREKYDLAIADFEKAIQFRPKYVNAYYNLGLIYQNTKKYDLAVKHYDLALKYDSEYTKAYINKCLLYMKTNRFDLALKEGLRAIETNKNSGKGHYFLAKIYKEKKDYKKSLTHLLRAKELEYDFDYNLISEVKEKIK